MIANKEFLAIVFGDEADSAHVTAFIDDPTSGTLDRRKWMGGKASSRLEWCTESRNTYFTVSTFNDDDDGVARRRKALFRAMPLVVVDDVGPKVQPGVCLEMLGEPSYRLETSPGNEQWGYLFNEPITDRWAAEVLVDEMIRRGLTADGTDPGMRGVTRYVRLPVGSNTKAKYGPQGFAHFLHDWKPSLLHDPYALARRMGFDLATAAAARRRAHEVTLEGVKGNKGEDALLAALELLGLVKHSGTQEDKVEITCPFLDEHTGRADNGTAYMAGGGGIACHHGHCRNRQRGDYVKKVCEELGKMGTAEADAAIHNLTSVAVIRKEMFGTATAVLRRLDPEGRAKVIAVGVREGMEHAVAELHADEMIKKASETLRQEELGNRPVVGRVARRNPVTGKLEVVEEGM
jgi:hypothetical protein